MLAALLKVLKGSPVAAVSSRLPVAAKTAGSLDKTPLPETAAQHIALGNASLKNGRLDEAERCYRKAISAAPDRSDAHLNLGYVLTERGHLDEAVPALQQATNLDPTSSDAHYLLGVAYAKLGDLALSIRHLETAIALQPSFVIAYRDLGKALCDSGRNEAAEEALRRGIAVDSTSADLHYFLGNVQAAETRFDEALTSYGKALDLQPAYASVHSNRALALFGRCDYAEAIGAARAALALDPQMHHARSNLLIALSRHAECGPDDYLAEAKAYGAAVCMGTDMDASTAPVVDPDPSRRLRIGFVSGDLRSHPVGYFLEKVMAHWNEADMEPIAYSNHRSHDDLTARLKGCFSRWRDISAASDEVAERQILSDQIDVLVDLSGHTADNRLPLFARRPAPVQATWLGYWASTGVPAIDYLLCDPVSVPQGGAERFTESPWHLPDTRLCFSPPAGADALAVAEPPALRSGCVTFGSFQNLTKLNDAVLRLWARVLEAVPGSRLRLQSLQLKTPAAQQKVLERMVRAGMGAERLQIADPGTRLQYLAAHAEVDILLDTFPHGGATTTCEALWMGVPTVTLAGATLLERQGASLLSCAGLAEWIARDTDEYLGIAVRHASDLAALASLRRRLRQQVEASPLFDAALFAAHLQAALRGMWRLKACGRSADRGSSQSDRQVRPTHMQ